MADQESDDAEFEMQPAAELLPVVYAELRRLATAAGQSTAAWPDPSADSHCPRGIPAPGWRSRPRLERPPPLLRRGGAGDADILVDQRGARGPTNTAEAVGASN